MNTEPPTGDDLQQMLVSMKREVLTRADQQRPAPRRRGRRAGIVIGVIAVLGIGAASGGVALGMIPQPFAAAPAPAPNKQSPTVTPTPSSAPVVEEPSSTPTSTSTPTPTRPPFDLADPSSWTVSGDEFGPVAIGGATAAETDDLTPAYLHDGADDVCGPEFGSYWVRDAQPTLIVWSESGSVIGVSAWVSSGAGAYGTIGPTTSSGIGIGSTLAEVRAAYPAAAEDPERSRYVDPPTAPNAFTAWKADTGTGPVWFGLDEDGIHVVSVDIGRLSGISCD